MVSITIGVIVTLTATTFYASALGTRHTVEARLAVQEDRSFAVRTLQRYIAQAGHRPLRRGDISGSVLPVETRDGAFPAVAADAEGNGGWAAGRYVHADADGVAVRFLGASDGAGNADGSLSDCTGAAIGADELGEMRFGVANDRLVCSVDGVDTTLAGGDGDTRVTGLDVSLGIDDDGDGSADRMIEADAGVPDGLVSLVLSFVLESERGAASDTAVVSVALRN